MTSGATQHRIDTEAAEWHARIAADAPDWDAFALWLDLPGHRDAYDRIALLDDEIGGLAGEIVKRLPANDLAEEVDALPARRRGGARWWAAGGVAAAVLAGIVSLPALDSGGAPMTAYSTGPAATRLIALKDGSTILLDRNSRLAVADGDARRVELASGGAYFDVRHDPARPFTVAAGSYAVRDVGTKFDMSRGEDHLSVAVAEGEVAVAPEGGEATSLTAGRRIDIAVASRSATVRRIAPADVAGWRRGQLVYDDAPMAMVAADVARYARRPLTVDPAVAGMRFSGVLTIGDGSGLVDQLQRMLAISIRPEGRGFRLVGARPR